MGARDFTVEGRRVVVVGAARSGIAAAELLVQRGARVTLSEMRRGFEGMERLQTLGVQLELGGHVSETLAAADLVVTSPGVALEQPAFEPARRRGVEIIGELELASRWVEGRIIAITGTKGKSTTTTLVGRMLTAGGRTALVGGNIGVPLSAQVGASTAATIHVVEASSFQLEATTTFRPWIALWLNLADDHLDRHEDAAAYAAAKARIFTNQRAEDFAVLNADDAVVRELGTRGRAQQIWFSPAEQIPEGFVVEGTWIARRTRTSVERLIPAGAVELKGRHMLGNVVAAAAVAWLAGVDAQAMTSALHGFRGLEHAMEPAGEIGRVSFVNDSKATNVEAACRSIESFDRSVVAIIGGRFKGGDMRELAAPMRERGRAVIAIGEAAGLVRDALAAAVPVVEAGSMREAVERGYEAAMPDGTVVLAPACASFDWFKDYAERGRAFKDEVAQLRRRVMGGGRAGEAPRTREQ